MAAGLSVEEENLPLLKKALLEKCPLSSEDVIPVVKIDSPLALPQLNEEIVEEIESLRPFGKGNASPLLAVKDVEVTRMYFMGKEKNFMKFRFKCGNYGYVEGINFDKYDIFKEDFISKYGEERFLKLLDDGYCDFKMDLIYYPTINEFNGRRSIQLSIKNFRL